ncbi:hypothetical protein GCM10010331_69440 [Streptomyces xanthochromogenes]|uniref:hypothetical protein n=1 Tax=Streptomyces xanthochromogenes TaxID=67384 RepID=UPI0016760E1F|nr:hypothetical protein [Streptomyces xanthochromogenes]GHB71623.1 hypothetical protein GCM10010331_69440 [Streptomyces xanthochromogenes]
MTDSNAHPQSLPAPSIPDALPPEAGDAPVSLLRAAQRNEDLQVQIPVPDALSQDPDLVDMFRLLLDGEPGSDFFHVNCVSGESIWIPMRPVVREEEKVYTLGYEYKPSSADSQYSKTIQFETRFTPPGGPSPAAPKLDDDTAKNGVTGSRSTPVTVTVPPYTSMAKGDVIAIFLLPPGNEESIFFESAPAVSVAVSAGDVGKAVSVKLPAEAITGAPAGPLEVRYVLVDRAGNPALPSPAARLTKAN